MYRIKIENVIHLYLSLLSQINITNVIPTEGRNLLAHQIPVNINLCALYRFLLASLVEMTGLF